jgi:hypothetical protein
VDAVDDFDSDVMVATVLDEGAFEAGVAPQLGEANGTGSGTVGDGDPTDVVRGFGFQRGVMVASRSQLGLPA